MAKEKRSYNKKAQARGGKKLIHVRIFNDQPEAMQKHIERNGGTMTDIICDGIDLITKTESDG